MDCLLHEGSKVLFRTALSILRVREQDLLAAPGVMEAYFLLRVPFGQDNEDKNNFHGVSAAVNEDLIGSVYGSWLKGFSTDILLKLRKEHLATVNAEDEAMEASRAAYKAKQEAAKQAKQEQEKANANKLALPEEAESPAEKLRRSSLELLQPLDLPLPQGAPGNTFGFLERAADAPTAAATWLAMVTGQEVHEDDEASTPGAHSRRQSKESSKEESKP